MDSKSYILKEKKSKVVVVIFLLVLGILFSSLITTNVSSWSLNSDNFDSSLTIISGGGITDSNSSSYQTDIAMAQSVTGSTNSSLFTTMLGFFFSMGAGINQVPSITNVEITPNNPKVNDDLTCTATGWSDVDIDSAQYHFDWYNQSKHYLHVLQASNVHVLNSGNTTRWEIWNCTVTPYDGIVNGSSLMDSVLVNNTAPTDPTVVLSATTKYNRTTDNLTVSIISGTDFNNDSITNITDWRKEGVSIATLNLPCDTNDSGIVKDYSTYGNDGTVNDATWTSSGKIGGAYSFDGVDDSITSSYDLDGKTEFGIGGWFKTAVSSYGNTMGIIGQPTLRIMIQTDGDFRIYAYNTTTGSQVIRENSGLLDEEWYHFFVNKNSTNWEYYLDGDFIIASSLIAGSLDDRSGTLNIGFPSADYLRFNGTMDEIQIYDNVLTANQIKVIHQAGIASHSTEKIHSDETSVGDNWTVAVTPNDGYEDGNTIVSNVVQIKGNEAPSKVVLVSPANEEDTSINRTQILNWSAATDAESDPLTYELNLTRMTYDGEPSCSVNKVEVDGISLLNYTTQELCVDEWYNWTVRAYDGYGYGEWSDIWNFTIGSYIDVTLLQGSINFGSLSIADSDNTSDKSPNAFKMENSGNVKLNFTIYGNNSLWIRDTALLNTSYFQFKANTSEESGSFATETSQMDWINVTDYAINLLDLLDYSGTKDSALIDILITVPYSEPAGSKKSTLIITSSWG